MYDRFTADDVKSTFSKEDVSVTSSTSSIYEDTSSVVDSLPESDRNIPEVNIPEVSAIAAVIQSKFEKSMRFSLDAHNNSNETLDLRTESGSLSNGNVTNTIILQESPGAIFGTQNNVQNPRFHINKVEIYQNNDNEGIENPSKKEESSRSMEIVANEVEYNDPRRNWYKLMSLGLAVVAITSIIATSFLLSNGKQHETVSQRYDINEKLDNLTNILSNTTKTKEIITAIVGDLKMLIIDLENLVNEIVTDNNNSENENNDLRFGAETFDHPTSPSFVNFTSSLMDINHWKNLFTLNVYERILTYILATTWSQLICESQMSRVLYIQLNLLVDAVETIEDDSNDINEFEFIFKLQDLYLSGMFEEPLPSIHLGIESDDRANALLVFLMTAIEQIHSYAQYLNHSITSDERFLQQDLNCFIVRKYNTAKNLLFHLKDNSQTLVMINFISNILTFLSYLYGQIKSLAIPSSLHNENSMKMVIKEVLLYISNSLNEFERNYCINVFSSSVDESIYQFMKWRLKSLTGNENSDQY